MAEREASAKAQRGTKLGGLGDRKKAPGTGEWGAGGELGLAGRTGWEPGQVDLVGPLERGFCSSCKGVLNQRGM